MINPGVTFRTASNDWSTEAAIKDRVRGDIPQRYWCNGYVKDEIHPVAAIPHPTDGTRINVIVYKPNVKFVEWAKIELATKHYPNAIWVIWGYTANNNKMEYKAINKHIDRHSVIGTVGGSCWYTQCYNGENKSSDRRFSSDMSEYIIDVYDTMKKYKAKVRSVDDDWRDLAKQRAVLISNIQHNVSYTKDLLELELLDEFILSHSYKSQTQINKQIFAEERLMYEGPSLLVSPMVVAHPYEMLAFNDIRTKDLLLLPCAFSETGHWLDKTRTDYQTLKTVGAKFQLGAPFVYTVPVFLTSQRKVKPRHDLTKFLNWL